MRTQEQKAVWRHAQTLSMVAFVAVGAALFWLWTLLDRVSTTGYHDALEGALYVACFFAIFAVRPLTDLFYSRLTRR